MAETREEYLERMNGTRIGGPARPERGSGRKPASGYTGELGSRKPISEVGARTADGALACPKCGGTQFTAKRSTLGKLSVGVLAEKTRVRCVTCGTMFKRG